MPEYSYKKEPELSFQPTPWLTVALLLLCVWGLYQYQATHSLMWLKQNAFDPGRFFYHLNHGLWQKDLSMMWSATFAQVNIWQFIGSLYFLWVFGSTVEVRLGHWRYAVITVLGIVGGWAALAYSVGPMGDALYLGPEVLTCAYIGAYFHFIGEKKLKPQGAVSQYTGRFFNNEKDPDPREAFGISPWWFLIAFIAYCVIMHFVLSNMPMHFEPLSPIGAFSNVALGYVVSTILIVITSGTGEGNPLRRLALIHYKQLRKLDMTHEQALEGTARLLSLPTDQVKQWVTKGGGALPQG